MARPRAAERVDIRARAVEAAARLCALRGAEGVTLQAVAAEVGCRAPALYRYFRSKEALLLEVHDDGFRRLHAYKLDAGEAAGADALARLRLGGLAYVRFALENPNLYELMFSERGPHRELAALRERGDAAPADFARRSVEFLRRSVVACQEEGYLGGIDPDIAAFAFWSVVHGAVSLALRSRVPFGLEASPAAAAEGAVEAVMALVAASSSGPTSAPPAPAPRASAAPARTSPPPSAGSPPAQHR